MTDGGSDAFERVREAVGSLEEPRTARTIGAAAGVHPAVAEPCLASMVENGTVMHTDDGAGTVYYPDPIGTYLAELGDAVAPVDEELVRSVRRDLADWRRFSAEWSADELEEFCWGGRLLASSRIPAGPHVYDADWDVLVILDTCRVDALRAVADEFDVLREGSIESRVSRGSQTAEWLSATFTADRLDDVAATGYVSGNGWVTGVFEDGLRPDDDLYFDAPALPTEWDVVDADAFDAVVDAWRLGPGEYSIDTPWGPHPSPRTVTDHAIGLARERDPDRIVAHYKQPHPPHTERARREGRNELTVPEASPRSYLEQGGDLGVVWECYLADLRAALASVETLCRNVDGRVAITADHGQAYGERGEFGHNPAMVNPAVKRVPWTTTTATDEGTREGDLRAMDATARDVEDHLEALGYR